MNLQNRLRGWWYRRGVGLLPNSGEYGAVAVLRPKDARLIRGSRVARRGCRYTAIRWRRKDMGPVFDRRNADAIR